MIDLVSPYLGELLFIAIADRDELEPGVPQHLDNVRKTVVSAGDGDLNGALGHARSCLTIGRPHQHVSGR